jgi:hypothetical protein
VSVCCGRTASLAAVAASHCGSVVCAVALPARECWTAWLCTPALRLLQTVAEAGFDCRIPATVDLAKFKAQLDEWTSEEVWGCGCCAGCPHSFRLHPCLCWRAGLCRVVSRGVMWCCVPRCPVCTLTQGVSYDLVASTGHKYVARCRRACLGGSCL